MISHEEAQKIFDQVCLICGRPNRLHQVFWSAYENVYMRQFIAADIELVPSSDHYACIDNLEYLEYEAARKKL